MRPPRLDTETKRRLDESMSLLVDLSTSSLDPGYAEAARRRAGDPSSTRAGGTRAGRAMTLAFGVLAATLVVVLAAVQAHVRAPAAARNRADLVAAVQRQSRAVDALDREVGSLRADVTRLRDAQLTGTASGASLAAQLRAEELAGGAVAVAGPGLRVTLDDAAAAGTTGTNRVLDRDLQAVVNALWASGAEAVAINGQRLTAQSAIRQAGDAILVDFQPLSPPYHVDAVGDPIALETGFGSSAAAARLRDYVQLYGLRFRYTRESRLELPAAAGESLHYARPLPSPRARGGRR
jgi:uncharacterized protein YlxW (UPF0749 family)